LGSFEGVYTGDKHRDVGCFSHISGWGLQHLRGRGGFSTGEYKGGGNTPRGTVFGCTRRDL